MERKNNVVKVLFVLFCLFQLVFDGFIIYIYFDQTKRLDVQDELLMDFVGQGNILQDKFYALSYFHNRQVESLFINNRKLETTTKNFIGAMAGLSDTNLTTASEFENCITFFKDPILIEEPHLKFGAERITGYIIHLFDKSTFKEIGYTIFDETFVDYNIYDCGRAFYNETDKSIDIELV